VNDPAAGEQILWHRLSVFAGSFTLAAAEAVCSGEGVEQDVVSLLTKLVDQSQVGIEGQGEEPRYRLPETLRQQARERLEASGEVDTVYGHLADYYLVLAEQAHRELLGDRRVIWLDLLEREHINLRTALSWFAKRGEAEQGLRLASALRQFWSEEAHMQEGREWLGKFLALPQVAGRTARRAFALDVAGGLALCQGDYAAARPVQEESLALYRELDDRRGIGYALIHLGHTARGQDEYVEARHLYEESLEVFQQLNIQGDIAHSLANLGNIAADVGDYAAARVMVEESLATYRSVGNVWAMVHMIGNAAGVAAGLGQPDRALRLAGAAAAQRETKGVPLPLDMQFRLERLLEPARQALDEAAQAAAWEDGRAMSLEEAVTYALEDGVENCTTRDEVKLE
jgi:tetratricopeptide (TPR) repeat protein